ncbi:snoRNP complex protein nop56 [Coelomomyces lativittatus]|nr:snoRNP complex protein nop56 [Coelomomyces lativittatus]KAJ1498247.1 snoRNP complex protein nop56 [Coelomomyces lativittatus]
MSMGTAISIVDLQNVILFADRVISLLTYRHSLHGYLKTKMQTVAPNMTELLGEMVGAKLISHAGSLTNLSKYPASTVQLLGAEKALFRALKTKSNTPKFGILYHASYLGKVGSKHKGRMARMVANKCAMASRVDAYMDPPEEQPLSTSSISSSISNTSMFGKQLKLELEKVIAKYEGKSNSLVSNPTLSTSRTTSTTSKLSKATTTSTFKKSHLPKSKVVSRVH